MSRASTKLAMFSDIVVRGTSDVYNAVIALAVITLIARQLDAADYGVYTQIITTASLLLPLVTLRLNTACVRFFPSHAADVTTRRRHFTTACLVVLLLAIAITAVLVAADDVAALLIFGEAVPARVILLLGAYLALRCVVTLFTDYFRAMNRSTRASLYNSLRFTLTLAALVVALFRETDVTGILYAYLVAETALVVIMGVQLVRERALGLLGQWSPAELAPYLAYSLPLLPYSLLLTVNQFADRYFITHIVGLDATGVYGFTYNLVMSAFLLNASISYVVYPHLTRLWEDGDMDAVREQLETGQRMFVFVAVPIAFGFCAIYAPIVTAMVGADFVVTLTTVVAIVLGQFWLGLCSIFGFIIDLSKRTTFFVKVLVVTASLNLLLNAVLVPHFGIEGAAIATAFTYATQLFMMWFATREIAPFPIRIDVRFIASCSILAGLMVIVIEQLQPITGPADILVAVALAVAVYAAGSAVVFRRRIDDLRNLLHDR